MRTPTAIAAGIAASAAVSTVLSCGGALTAGGHPLDAWSWLFQVSVVPCVLGALVLAQFASAAQRTRLSLHLAAIAVAFCAAVLAGSAGAITVEAHRRGWDHVNVQGYLAWCSVYAAALLPITYPAAFGVLLIVRRTREQVRTA